MCKEVLENAIGVYETTEKCGLELQPLEMVCKQACEELLEYKNLEEQGLLLKLPCPFGTKVYYVQKCLAPSCKECMGFVRVDNCYCEFKSRIFEQEFGIRHLKAFGKAVFLTREEAEEALRRMEEEKRKRVEEKLAKKVFS